MKDKFKSKDEQLKHQLIIADIQEVDSGTYSCECGTAKTSLQINYKTYIFCEAILQKCSSSLRCPFRFLHKEDVCLRIVVSNTF
jgi:hypothetical protein